MNISISDLPVSSQALFIKRFEKYISTNLEDIENGLYSDIGLVQDTLKELGLRYDKNGGKLYSSFELINDLSIIVGMEHDNHNGITEFDLQYIEERDDLHDYLQEHSETYSLTYFDSTIFSFDEKADIDIHDVLDTLNLLSQLNQSCQQLFVEIYGGYIDSPINLVNTLITNLKDW